MANPPKKPESRRGAMVAPIIDQPHGSRMMAWAEHPVTLKFLEESVFTEEIAFDNQHSNLFGQEAEELRNALMQTLTTGRSEENWKFLLAIHKINSQKSLSQSEMQTKLKAIEQQYINKDAPTRINLESSVLNKIVAIEKKCPADYQNIVKEVFRLIRQNIKTNAMLTTLDEINLLNDSVNKLIDTLNPLIAFQTEKLGFMSGFFPTKTDTKLFINCQKISKTMLADLRELVKSHKIVDVVNSKDSSETKIAKLSSLEHGFKNKLLKILSDTQNKLSERFAEMYRLEKVRGYSPKSEQVKPVIDAIKETIINLGLHVEPKSTFSVFKRD
jgi:hypothetical protein